MANAATWTERLGEWRKSGQSAVKFVEGRDFSSHQLWYWDAKVRKAAQAKQDGATPGAGGSSGVRLARVLRVSTAGTDSMPLAVEAYGLRVVVPPGFDRATFTAVIDELETRAARVGKR